MFHADLYAPGLRQNQLSDADDNTVDSSVHDILSTILLDFCKCLHTGTTLSF